MGRYFALGAVACEHNLDPDAELRRSQRFAARLRRRRIGAGATHAKYLSKASRAGVELVANQGFEPRTNGL